LVDFFFFFFFFLCCLGKKGKQGGVSLRAEGGGARFFWGETGPFARAGEDKKTKGIGFWVFFGKKKNDKGGFGGGGFFFRGGVKTDTLVPPALRCGDFETALGEKKKKKENKQKGKEKEGKNRKVGELGLGGGGPGENR